MAAVPLAFLNLGPTEVLVILALFLFLFGADKLPGMARSLGKFQAQVQKAYREFSTHLETKEEREFREQVEFERMREAQIRASSPEYQAEIAMRRAAEELGIPTEGRPLEDVQRDIAARVAPPKDGPGEPPR